LQDTNDQEVIIWDLGELFHKIERQECKQVIFAGADIISGKFGVMFAGQKFPVFFAVFLVF